MAKKAKFEETFDVPREKLLEVLTDPETSRHEAVEVGGALEAEARKEEAGEGKVKIVLDQKVYARGLDGKKDKSKTENARFIEEWDLRGFESSWTYRMESAFADKVKVEGRKRIVDKGGSACRYVDETTVSVDVPMIGNMIAGKVISSLEKAHPRRMEWLKKKLHEG